MSKLTQAQKAFRKTFGRKYDDSERYDIVWAAGYVQALKDQEKAAEK